MALPRPSSSTTAIVTGASSGLGVHFATELATLGHHVTIVARREEPMVKLAAEIKKGGAPEPVLIVVADLATKSGREALWKKLEAAGRTPSVLINNAGFSTTGPVSSGDEDREVALVRTNVEAVVSLTTSALGSMVDKGQGAILNVASTAAFQPLPGQAAYGASKAFVLSYTYALAAEVVNQNITVTALCPGPVETGFAEAAGFSEEAVNVLPKIMWVDAEKVARAGLEGLGQGTGVVIPGAANRLTARLSRHAGQAFVSKILAKRHPQL